MALVCVLAVQAQDSTSTINADGMKALYNSGEAFKLLDVQTMEEHMDYGFPPKSMCVPLKLQDSVTKEWSDNSEFLEQIKRRIKPDETIVLLCSSGKRAASAARILAEAGYSKLMVFENGIHGKETETGEFLPGWIDTDLPFVNGMLNE